jgi:hypothetical protein
MDEKRLPEKHWTGACAPNSRGKRARRASDLIGLTRPALRQALAAGHPVDPSALNDTEYRGISLGLPAWVERLSWKKFKKVFHRDPESGALRGWNVRLEQNELDGPCVPLEKKGEPFTFGHYVVVDPEGRRVPKGADRGLLIHYGLGRNARFDPMSFLRDPIVCVNEDDPTLLLGWSYLDLGWFRLGTPSFFTLEYDGPLSHRVKPPRDR